LIICPSDLQLQPTSQHNILFTKEAWTLGSVKVERKDITVANIRPLRQPNKYLYTNKMCLVCFVPFQDGGCSVPVAVKTDTEGGKVCCSVTKYLAMYDFL